MAWRKDFDRLFKRRRKSGNASDSSPERAPHSESGRDDGVPMLPEESDSIPLPEETSVTVRSEEE